MLKPLLIRSIQWYQQRGGGMRYRVDCNFTPTCSEYTKQAIIKFGAFKGMSLAIKRIKRCNCPDQLHPIADPVPECLSEDLRENFNDISK